MTKPSPAQHSIAGNRRSTAREPFFWAPLASNTSLEKEKKELCELFFFKVKSFMDCGFLGIKLFLVGLLVKKWSSG